MKIRVELEYTTAHNMETLGCKRNFYNRN